MLYSFPATITIPAAQNAAQNSTVQNGTTRLWYLSFTKGELDPREHLPNMRVQLRMMNADGTDDHRLLSFFGGQGSINVNRRAPDSRRVAIVLYELHHHFSTSDLHLVWQIIRIHVMPGENCQSSICFVSINDGHCPNQMETSV